MILSIAIQFIPTLLEESDNIRKAQIARGARFESGKLRERAMALVPMLVPVFLSAFKRADELSVAMEARGYHGGDGRTKLYPLKYAARDYISYAVLLLYIGAIVSIGITFSRLTAFLLQFFANSHLGTVLFWLF